MYQKHQPIISAWARAHPDNFARVMQFCMISARVRFQNVPATIEAAEQGDPGALFGWKQRAYQEAWFRRHDLRWNCEDIFQSDEAPETKANHLLSYLAHEVYGLNTAKAGFFCQLVYGVSGCLDAVNVDRLGLPKRFCPNFYTLRTPQARLRRAGIYNTTVQHLGGTVTLWDDWCEAVSARNDRQSPFTTAEDVSAWHLECLNL